MASAFSDNNLIRKVALVDLKVGLSSLMKLNDIFEQMMPPCSLSEWIIASFILEL